MTLIDPNRVEEILNNCLHTTTEEGGEPTDGHADYEGIVGTYCLHPGRVDDHKLEIGMMLENLPVEFQEKGGGGWSFLNACDDKDGNQWTGLHRTMEHLFILGMAIGRVKPLLPRELWVAFPGGMPYYVVTSGD